MSVVTFFFLINSITFIIIVKCDAQLLSAYEQAYGLWSLQLTRSLFSEKWHVEAFPEGDDNRSWNGSRTTTITKNCTKDSCLRMLFPMISREGGNIDEDILPSYSIKKTRSLPCILDLEQSGKFTLYLADNSARDNDNQFYLTSDHTLMNSKIQPVATSSLHEPLKGEWYISPNPYCVTDRQYDTLTLLSEPRFRHVNCEANIIEKARVEFRCKIWGRYGVGGVRNRIGLQHGRMMGRMNHGTVMVVKEYVKHACNTDKILRREVIASFQGKAICNSDKLAKDKNVKGKLIDYDDSQQLDFDDYDDD